MQLVLIRVMALSVATEHGWCSTLAAVSLVCQEVKQDPLKTLPGG